MNFGIIRGIALVWHGSWPVFRVLAAMSDNDWLYLYIGATNYQFRENDIVSWDDSAFYWHTERTVVRFDLLKTGVTTT